MSSRQRIERSALKRINGLRQPPTYHFSCRRFGRLQQVRVQSAGVERAQLQLEGSADLQIAEAASRMERSRSHVLSPSRLTIA